MRAKRALFTKKFVFCIIPYYSLLFRIILYWMTEWIRCIILYYSVLFCIILYYSLLFCIIPYYSVLFRIILYYSVLFCIIPYYSILFRIIRYYSALFHIILSSAKHQQRLRGCSRGCPNKFGIPSKKCSEQNKQRF